MKLLRTYIKHCRMGLFIFVLFCAIFLVTFALYHLPLKAVIYPILLCAFLGILIGLIRFSHIRQKHTQLSELSRHSATEISALPEAESVEEEDYQEMVRTLLREISNLETLNTARYQNMMEYYTIWVHQIKTPIASMQLTLQNQDTPLSRKLSSDLFRIEQYVEMVLAYLRLDFTSGDYVFKEHRIDDIISQSVAKFASEFIDRKITLVYEPVSKTVITDDKWFSFVIEQALSNALKYTRKGSIKIYLRDSKILCIEDTGIGISPEDLPRIFEKGYTGYNGRIDKKASGIGLYLCKRICENLGTRISITSTPGIGTTVQIQLDQYELKAE